MFYLDIHPACALRASSSMILFGPDPFIRLELHGDFVLNKKQPLAGKVGQSILLVFSGGAI